MRTRIRGALWSLLAAGIAMGQDAPQQPVEGARDLFYFGATGKEAMPPIRKTSAKAKPTPGASAQPGRSTATAAATAEPADPMAVPHLGFRYTVNVVDEGTGKSAAVDPDRDFRKGECVRIELETNQSGYLYVLSRQSSGGWLPLFPSAEMPDESNVIDPGQRLKVPKDYCFEINDPPGTETLFVALSRSRKDFFELYDAIRPPAPAAPAGGGTSPSNGEAMQLADARVVGSAVEKMAAAFGTRDLAIRKVKTEADKPGTDYSVYVVSSSDKPASTVVRKVEIRHP